MPYCDDKELKIAKDEDEERGEVCSKFCYLSDDARDGDRAGEVRILEVRGNTDPTNAVCSVVEDAG